MKILMTADTIGGVWTYALQLAKSLADYDAQIELATLGAPLSASQHRSAAALTNLTVHESSFRLEWMDDPWDDVRATGDWLRTLADRLSPDLVHLNDYSQGAMEWEVPVLMVAHSCVPSWYEAVRGAPAGSEWDRYRAHVSGGLAGADLVVAPTAAMLDSLRRLYGPFRNSTVIYNGRDNPVARSEIKKDYILTAGRLWDDAKNIGALDRAARDVPWPICVAGATTHPNGGEVEFANLRRLGRLEPDAMDQWFCSASIYVHPARYEPFGLAPLEAAQRGCALVLADIPSLHELWQDAALYARPDCPAELAAALNRLVDDPRLRREYAKRAGARAARFSARRMGREYHSAYRGLLEASTPVIDRHPRLAASRSR